MNNRAKGLCPICAKPKEKWEKGQRVYCGKKCSDKYQECFITWNSIKDKILSERGFKCEKCGLKTDYLELDHKIALMNGGDMWNKKNLQLLCKKCHNKKTRQDHYRKRMVKKNQTTLI